MKNTFTDTEIANEAIKGYKIDLGDKNAIKQRIAKKIRRFVDEKYGKGTKINESIKKAIFSWDGLREYFETQANKKSKGKKYYEALAKQMKDEKEKYYTEWYQSSELENPTHRAIEEEIRESSVRTKFHLMDKMMFEYYLNTKDENYQKGYKIIAQNNFTKDMLEYSKITFFKIFFDSELFTKDALTYFYGSDDDFGADTTPETAEILERFRQEGSYKYYLIENRHSS